MSEVIVLSQDFKRPRYMGGLWLDQHTRWSPEDMTLLVAACDMGISPNSAANTLGRAPTNLAHKALELGIRIPKRWSEMVRAPHLKKKSEKLNLNYPYVVQPDDRHADLIAVNRMVSSAMPGREDVCQDMMLALWESRTSLEELRNDPKALRAFVSAFRKASYERSGYGVESMDVTIDVDDGRSKYELEQYQRTLGHHESNFESAAIEAIEKRELSTGVPAAFWARVTAPATPSQKKLRVRRPKAPREMVFHAELKKWVRLSEL